MPSTYLTLVNNVLNDINEVELTSSDFAAASGIHKKVKNAVNNSLREINSLHDNWPFNSSTDTQLLTVGTVEYDFPSDYKTMDWLSFFIQDDSSLGVNNKTLRLIEKNDWYQYYRDLDNNAGADGRNVPDYVFHSHGRKYGITPSPNQAYTVEFNYYTKFTPLSAYDDETTVYTEYDHVIQLGALKHLNLFLDNPEQAAYIDKEEFKPALGAMRKQLINDDVYMRSTQIVRRAVKENGVTI